MKLIQTLSFCLLLSLNWTAKAQNFDLGKVTLAELEEKQHPKDTAAVAAILFEKGKVNFEYSQDNGFTMITDVTTRIKIYKKEGYDWAVKKVGYSINSGAKEGISFSDAVTYNVVNGKIEKTKLKSDGVFDEKVNKYWAIKKISLPNVKEGSVIEYSYRKKSPRLSELTDWAFQTSIPVNYSEFKTYVPEYFVYTTNMRGYLMPKKTVETSQKTLSYFYKEAYEGGKSALQGSTSQEKLVFLETKTTYVAENVPALKEEAYVNNINNYTTSVGHELSSIHYPNQPFKNLSTNWESVARAIYENEDFGAELNKTDYFEETLRPVIAGLTSAEEKINAIFNHVKSTMTWNDYYGYSCIDGVKIAYKNKTGNTAEINLMLTAMLRFAGLEAHPVLVSTRDNGIALFPSRTAFNHVIASVEVAENLILLDATSKNSVPNVLPIRDLNWSGRLIRKDGTSTEVDLMPKVLSNDIVTMSYTIAPTGKISGKTQHTYTNHNALVYRNQVKNVTEDVYLEKFENENGKIEVTEYKRNNENELLLPVSEVVTFSADHLTDIIQDKIYLNPLLFFTYKENPFKQETRAFPIDYSFPFMDKFSVNLQIPEGYSVETMPASINLVLQDELGGFKFLTNVIGSTIQISAQHQIKSSIIGAEYYDALKEYYKKVIEKMNEKIVLKKA
jgi:hypothetical protein